jgi:hypothetical protein
VSGLLSAPTLRASASDPNIRSHAGETTPICDSGLVMMWSNDVSFKCDGMLYLGTQTMEVGWHLQSFGVICFIWGSCGYDSEIHTSSKGQMKGTCVCNSAETTECATHLKKLQFFIWPKMDVEPWEKVYITPSPMGVELHSPLTYETVYITPWTLQNGSNYPLLQFRKITINHKCSNIFKNVDFVNYFLSTFLKILHTNFLPFRLL